MHATLHSPPQTANAPRPAYLRTLTYHGLAPGPRLLILGAVHGNETCGTQAITQLISELDSGQIALERGTLTLLPVTNPLAYQLKQRSGERNLNRNMGHKPIAQDFEDRIANALCPLLDTHDVTLDLHSFHTGGAPFAMLGPQNNRGTLEPFCHASEELALALHAGPHRIVEGWLETYARGAQRRSSGPATNPNYGVGTVEYTRSRGGYGITLECGQHDDPQAVHVARLAILQTLALLGLAALPLQAMPAEREILRLVDVTDFEHPGDHFSRNWDSFDPVKAGELIGTRHDGEPVTAPDDGFMVFPNPQAEVGGEWFYFAKKRAA